MSKGLEALERLENEECYTDYEYRMAYDDIRKELKAWNIVKKHLSIVVPINDVIEIFDIDLWNDGKQKEDFEFIKEMMKWNWKNILSGNIPKSWKGERERMAIPKNKTRLTITIHKESKHLLDELLALHNDSYSQVFEYALYFYAKTLLESFDKIEKQEKGEKENAKD